MTRRVIGVVSVAKLRAMGLDRIPLRENARWAVYYTPEAARRIAAGGQVDPTLDTAVVRGVIPEQADRRFYCRVPGLDGAELVLGGWLDPVRGVVLSADGGGDTGSDTGNDAGGAA